MKALFIVAAMCCCLAGCQLPRVGDVGRMIKQHESRDLRLLFCDEEALRQRISRGVCTVWLPGLHQPIEVHVGQGLSLEEVIAFVIPGGWLTQTRAVSKNAIVQTPFSVQPQNGSSPVDAIRILPGDLVFFPRVQ